jgi:hypothetical protein
MMKHTRVRNYTDDQLLDQVKSLPNFRTIPNSIWILGVRSNEDTPNVYDDKFYIFDHDKCVDVLTGTTNCGLPALKGGYKKYNKHGAFVLKSDMWHHSMWKYVYRATRGHELRQVYPVQGYRDGNNDDKNDEIGPIVTGYFGINFHTNTFKWYNAVIKWFIGWNSAGCQVTNDRIKYIKWLNVFKQRLKSNRQNNVTYCLINEFVPENA